VEDFGFCQNTGETLPDFRQESRKGKMVICARQLPDVGHAQGLVRIPKWNWDRESRWHNARSSGQGKYFLNSSRAHVNRLASCNFNTSMIL
ncbi:Ribosomal protein L1p/L10e family, partial [Prunus dulcis]